MTMHQPHHSDLDRLEDRYNAVLPGLGLSRFVIWLVVFNALLPFALVAATLAFDLVVRIAAEAGAPTRGISITATAIAQLGDHFNLWRDRIVHPLSHSEAWLFTISAVLMAIFANRASFPVAFVVFWLALVLLMIAAHAFAASQAWPAFANLTARSQPFFEGNALDRFITQAWMTILLVWFAVVAAIQIVVARRMDAHTRNLISDITPGQRLGWRDVVYLFGLPPNLGFAARKWTTSIFWVIGNFTVMIPFLIANSLAIPLWMLVVQIEPYVHPGFASQNTYSWGFAESVGFLVIAIVLALTVFRTLLKASRRYLRHSIEAIQSKDGRKPVLFLRSFRDDAVALSRPRMFPLASVFDPSRAIPNLELVVLQEATPVGPVVALGSPDDKIPPYGIARGYFKNHAWREGVKQLATAANFIVITLDETEGVMFEVNELILPMKLAEKTLFLVHPHFTKKAQAPKLLAMLDNILEALGSEAERQSHDFGTSLPLAIFKDRQTGRVQVLYSSTFSWAAYFLTVRRYVRQQPWRPQQSAL